MKSFVRRIALPFSRYHAYATPAAGWAGYYRLFGWAVGFKGVDGRISTSW